MGRQLRLCWPMRLTSPSPSNLMNLCVKSWCSRWTRLRISYMNTKDSSCSKGWRTPIYTPLSLLKRFGVFIWFIQRTILSFVIKWLEEYSTINATPENLPVMKTNKDTTKHFYSTSKSFSSSLPPWYGHLLRSDSRSPIFSMLLSILFECLVYLWEWTRAIWLWWEQLKKLIKVNKRLQNLIKQ